MTNVEKIIESLIFIEWNMKEDIDASRISAEVGYSPHYFRKLFRRVTGLSLETYLCRRRLTEAFKALKQNPDNAIKITYEYRFKCLKEFTKTFFRQFKTYPAEFHIKQPASHLKLQEAIVYDVIHKAGL